MYPDLFQRVWVRATGCMVFRERMIQCIFISLSCGIFYHNRGVFGESKSGILIHLQGPSPPPSPLLASWCGLFELIWPPNTFDKVPWIKQLTKKTSSWFNTVHNSLLRFGVDTRVGCSYITAGRGQKEKVFLFVRLARLSSKWPQYFIELRAPNATSNRKWWCFFTIPL